MPLVSGKSGDRRGKVYEHEGVPARPTAHVESRRSGEGMQDAKLAKVLLTLGFGSILLAGVCMAAIAAYTWRDEIAAAIHEFVYGALPGEPQTSAERPARPVPSLPTPTVREPRSAASTEPVIASGARTAPAPATVPVVDGPAPVLRPISTPDQTPPTPPLAEPAHAPVAIELASWYASEEGHVLRVFAVTGAVAVEQLLEHARAQDHTPPMLAAAWYYPADVATPDVGTATRMNDGWARIANDESAPRFVHWRLARREFYFDCTVETDARACTRGLGD